MYIGHQENYLTKAVQICYYFWKFVRGDGIRDIILLPFIRLK